MAVAEQPTYTFIPPPPLPEFYLPKQKKKDESSSSSSSSAEAEAPVLVTKGAPTAMDGTYEIKTNRAATMPRALPTQMLAVPPLPPNVSGTNVPPLAIYHICRLCLRPRSPRYHREHPIPIDGLPPPPSICRRCRVTTVEETKKVAEIVTQGESNEIKLGCILPFVPDEDIISSEEMKAMKAERWLRERSGEYYTSRRRSKPRKDITYRHVRVVDEPVNKPPHRVRKVAFTSQDAIDSFDDEPIPEPPCAPAKATTSMQVQPTLNPPSVAAKTVKNAALRNIDSTKASTSSGSTSTVKALAEFRRRAAPAQTDSEIRKIAKEEIDQRAGTQWTEADIRRLSREEVQRYREAERRVESHPDPYAHGKMVPVERRIATEKDMPASMSWAKPSKEEKPKVSSTVKSKSDHSSRAPGGTSSTSKTSSGKEKTEYHSWGPKWRRDLSIERRRSETSHRGEKTVVEKAPDINEDPAAGLDKRDQPANVKSRQVYDIVEQASEPQRPSRRVYRAVDAGPRRAENRPKFVEVVEEIEYIYGPMPIRTSESVVTKSNVQPRITKTNVTEWEGNDRSRDQPKVQQSIRQSDQSSAQAPSSREHRTWSRSSKPTEREYWNDEAEVLTADSGSWKHYTTSGSGGTPRESYRENAAVRGNMSHSARGELDINLHGTEVSEKTTWPKEQTASKSSRQDPQKSAARPPDSKTDKPCERIVYPTDAPTEKSFGTGTKGSHRSSKAPPTKRSSGIAPPRSHHSSKAPETEYIYTERIVQPADRPAGSRPFDDYPAASRVAIEEYQETRRQPPENAQSRRRRKERREPHIRDSEDSNHVHFSSKIDISPTPPNSDASSSEFRSYHSISREVYRQIDGQQERERGGDLIAEYERGRTRSRDAKEKYDYQYERKSAREQDPGAGQAAKSGKGQREATYDGRDGRPLHGALSESPSRERFMAESAQARVDARGPYRDDGKITDSMKVQDGSHGGR